MSRFNLPDIPGAFQRGREFANVNALNDIALNRAERQQSQEGRVSDILSRMPNGDRGQVYNSLAAQGDPGMRAAAQLQRLDAGQRQAELHKAQQVGRTLISANPENYQSLKGEISRIAPSVAESLPEEYDENVISGYVNRLRSVESMLGGSTPSGLREFEGMTQGLSPEDRERARRIELGLDPRAVGSSAITTATQNLTAPVAESEATIAGAKAGSTESAKLDAQLNKLPDVRAAVKTAEEEAKLAASRGEESRQKTITLGMYETAMKGLSDALANTDTGPFAGKLPAVTSKQQIADGAIAIVAPILKTMFRAAGEGVFTDRDQELLMDMVPKRTDTPESANAKLEMLDAVVKAKLSIEGSVSRETQFQEGQTATNPQTGEKVIFQNGQWQPAS